MPSRCAQALHAMFGSGTFVVANHTHHACMLAGCADAEATIATEGAKVAKLALPVCLVDTLSYTATMFAFAQVREVATACSSCTHNS